jgi:ADP-ribosylation factor 2-binding protein
MDSEEIEEEIFIEDEAMEIESEDEFEITAFGQSADEDLFDTVVGRLEEIVMSEEFTMLQERFVKTYSGEFTSDEENKLIYMEIFQKYQNEIENYIERKLADVDMNHFMSMLKYRQHEIDGPLFEMLLSFSDFQVFKELMISYSGGDQLEISGTASIIHTDEVMDGEEFQGFGLVITGIKGKK